MTTVTSPWKVGDRIRFTHPHSDGSIIRFKVQVIRIEGDVLFCRVPRRVLSLPFPPFTASTVKVSASNPKAVASREEAK